MAKMTRLQYETQLINDVATFQHDPLSFVQYAYEWGSGELKGDGCESIRSWQIDILKVIRDHLQNKKTRHQPLRIAVSSGHGIGKSALIAMINEWALATREDTRIVITAETDTQLRTKTSPEITKWHNMSIVSHWFTANTTSVTSNDPKHDKLWRADLIPWSVHKPEAFQGLHNKGKRIILIFDEASAIDDKIWEVSEGALTDKGTEIIWIAFGNPTRCEGRFRECFEKYRHRWVRRNIDSRDVEGTNREQLQQYVDDYGEDSDYVKIRVRGIFPSASANQLVSREWIDECVKYELTLEEYNWHAKVMGVDLARFGSNQSVICHRQGRKVDKLVKWRNMDGMFSAGMIVEEYNRARPDAVFIDTGGLGGPIADRVKQLIPPEKVFCIDFAGKANKVDRYHNKRAEMWGDAADAIKVGMDLPDDEEFATDLTAVTYYFDGKQRIQLVKKEDMAMSPDCGDALALTFAMPVIREKGNGRIKKKIIRHVGCLR